MTLIPIMYVWGVFLIYWAMVIVMDLVELTTDWEENDVSSRT